MKIGELAEKAGVSTQTVRFYERSGLLSAPARRANGYREYGREALAEIAFLRECRNAGFTLREIGHLGRLSPKDATTCTEMSEFLRRKIAGVDRKIADLKQVRARLVEMQSLCEGASDDACAPLERLHTG